VREEQLGCEGRGIADLNEGRYSWVHVVGLEDVSDELERGECRDGGGAAKSVG
jgi:hypothetical protein